MPERVRLSVYDKHCRWQGDVGEYLSLTATRRHLAVDTAEFTVAADLDLRDVLGQDGAHVVVHLDDRPFVSGWVSSDSGTVLANGPLTYTVDGHFALLTHLLGWPVPAADLDSQTVAYWKLTGPAETVAKELVRQNAARLDLPVTIARDQGRGGSVTVKSRFHPLADRLVPKLTAAGIGLTVRLVEDAGLLVDTYQPTTHSEPLSVESGVIVAGTWSRSRLPTATRAAAGSQGEAEARKFFGPLADTAREDRYGLVVEVFVDARDTDDPDEVAERMQEALDEGAPTTSATVELVETPEFAYRDPFEVGDRVTLQLRPDVLIPDVISSAVLEHPEGGELTITPEVGARTDDPDALIARALARLAAGARDQKVR